MPNTAFLLAVIAVVISVGMFAFVYIELQEIKEIQRIEYEYQKELIERSEMWLMWDISEGRDASESQYWNMWKNYAKDVLVIDDRYLNRMYEYMEQTDSFP